MLTRNVGTAKSSMYCAQIGLQTRATSKIPFGLVYWMDVKLLINLKILVYQCLQQFTTNQEAVQERII